jgi:small subunit ribosomal protein S13
MRDYGLGPYSFSNRRHVEQSLATCYGIGSVKARKICGINGLLSTTPLKEIHGEEEIRDDLIRTFTSIQNLDYNLRLKIFRRIQELRIAGCYQTRRLYEGLPVRGQRTHTNASTQHRLKVQNKHLPIINRAELIADAEAERLEEQRRRKKLGYDRVKGKGKGKAGQGKNQQKGKKSTTDSKGKKSSKHKK